MITRNDGRAECQSLGSGYDLISNAQWQTIARNLELQGANWTSGTVGTGCMFQGNNGATLCGYNSGTDPISASSNSRGIFTLSNSETIYDFAGNVWEWTRDDNATNYGSSAFFSTITTATHTVMGTLSDGVARSAKAQFGPSGSYSTANANSGLGFGSISSSSGGVFRGGSWTNTNSVGVFYTLLTQPATHSAVSLGFRCTYAP